MGRVRPNRPRRARPDVGTRPLFPHSAVSRVREQWDRAIEEGLMRDGAQTKYHFLPTGEVLSVALGVSGDVLANGRLLDVDVANQLRTRLPGLASVVTFYEQNQAAGRGLQDAPADGIMAAPAPRR